jgi:UDP-N-acetylglucosamine:LPS N-acetylglucosamine transferase
LVAAGAAILLPQAELNPAKLAELISGLNYTICQNMGEKARSLAILDSTQQICQQIIEQL